MAPWIVNADPSHGIPELDWSDFHDVLDEGAPPVPTPDQEQINLYPNRKDNTWNFLANQILEEDTNALPNAMQNMNIPPSTSSTDPPQKKHKSEQTDTD